ncbi:GntR family transcriptional regulator [Actinocorallia longicatena]|uniref:GntR family transcriptional regulator n=1 Tax=Actinocorallia longicatena TaxID=111803 RepID=A0ABP6QK17_9ACTN
MPVEKPRSEYRQVVALLRAAIADGEFPPGALLPAEPVLAERFGVTRATVNRALAMLRTEGLVRPERGRGTTVNELPIIRRESAGRQAQGVREAEGSRGAFDAEIRGLGLVPEAVVSVAEVAAPAEVALLLGVEAGEPVLARVREMSADGVPVQLATSYLPLGIVGGTRIAEVDTGPGGTYSRLGELGYAPVEFTETVRVRTPAEDEVVALRMDEDQRVFAITRVAVAEGGRVVEVNRIVAPAHQWELVFS